MTPPTPSPTHSDDLAHRATLADGPVARIERCACGTIHLSVGGVTLRLHADAFDALCDTAVQALVALKLRHADPAALLAHRRGGAFA
jgi:hypothetical protein